MVNKQRCAIELCPMVFILATGFLWSRFTNCLNSPSSYHTNGYYIKQNNIEVNCTHSIKFNYNSSITE